jgi:hypothetical protein
MLGRGIILMIKNQHYQIRMAVGRFFFIFGSVHPAV